MVNITSKGLAGLGGPLLLHDGGIEEAIASGDINIIPELREGQLQPASLDVRVGKVRLYDEEAMAKTAVYHNLNPEAGTERPDYDPTTKFAKVFPDEKDIPIEIPSGSFVEMFLHEKIEADLEKYAMNVDLKSSRGRLGLSLHSRRIEEDKEGKYICFRNENPNTIRIYGQDKFAQVFFYPQHESVKNNGYMVLDTKEAEEIASQVCEGKFKIVGNYIEFSLGDHILKFKKKLGTIDTRTKYEDNFLYDLYKTSTILHFELNLKDAIIAQLSPKVNLPADVGIQILHEIPYLESGRHSISDLERCLIDNHDANAGWGDPGYKGRLTSHPIRRKMSEKLYKGKRMALGMLFKYSTPVKRPYGSKNLGSHYQNSEGSGSKS